ncbi:hypothetical protein ABVT39_010341 [Epinephelus coioides]
MTLEEDEKPALPQRSRIHTWIMNRTNPVEDVKMCFNVCVQSSPAMGLCPFIIHGVVLMAQAAMSDVNLCASKAHSGCTTSAGRVTARATVLRYHTTLNQHAQSHLGHIAHADPFV